MLTISLTDPEVEHLKASIHDELESIKGNIEEAEVVGDRDFIRNEEKKQQLVQTIQRKLYRQD